MQDFEIIISIRARLIATWLLMMVGLTSQALPTDSICVPDSDFVELPVPSSAKHNRHPWRTVGEIILIQSTINTWGRYVMDEPYAQTTLKSIGRNFKSSLVWDNDNFYLNNLGHTLQGALVFNSARSNGYSYWESVPVTIAGSFLWEYVGERDKPSINDMITTPLAGSLFGECSHRLSNELIDNQATGVIRFVREATTALINPVEGFHRIISGKAWRVLPNDEPKPQVNISGSYSVGGRYLSDANNSHQGGQLYISLAMDYGDMADGESHNTPFDYMSIDAALAVEKGQHLLSHFRLTGRICSTPLKMKGTAYGELGLYQFFNYEDTNLPSDTLPRSPFPFGEMGSLGPGFQFYFPHLTLRIAFQQQVYAHGIILGAVESDYYKFDSRHYNMGSGYGLSSVSRLTWQHIGNLQLRANYMHLYTWKGYEPRNLSELSQDDCSYLNVMGDHSNARLLSLSLQTRINLSPHLGITLGSSYYHRYTHYRYHPNRHAESYELRTGLDWQF